MSFAILFAGGLIGHSTPHNNSNTHFIEVFSNVLCKKYGFFVFLLMLLSLIVCGRTTRQQTLPVAHNTMPTQAAASPMPADSIFKDTNQNMETTTKSTVDSIVVSDSSRTQTATAKIQPPAQRDTARVLPFSFPYIVVNAIEIKGNRRTKRHIILRELDFSAGDTLASNNFENLLRENRNQIFNTRLFNDVSIKIAKQQQGKAQIDLLIEVEERWYIFPVPIFELTDRNFNEWWVTHKHDFGRTQYGFQFIHENFRGRREKLKLLLQLGYTQKVELNYQIPFLDKKGHTGINPSASYIRNHEITYKTIGNKQHFLKLTDGFARERLRVGINFTQRPDIHHFHSFNVYFNRNMINDTVALLNPDYFLEGRNLQQYISVSYNYIADNRDIAAYPLSGSFFRFQASKFGFSAASDINMFILAAAYSRYVPLSKRFYWAGNIRGKLSFPDRQPYFNQQGLGYGDDAMRGYEYYIIDGQKFGILRTSLRYRVLALKIINPLIKAHQFRTIPLSIYLKNYAETGYVIDKKYTQNNPLANQWLWSVGAGLDLFTAYDFLVSFEYSLNKQGEHGLYVSFKVNYD